MSPALTAFTIELWLLYALAISSVFLRIISRRISLGSFSKFQTDDYIMILIVFTFTASTICSNQIAEHVYDEQDLRHAIGWRDLIRNRWCRKIMFALEQFHLATVWLVKACLIIMFRRIFHTTRERQFIFGTGVFCAVSYLVMQILFLGVWCRPIQQYWNTDSRIDQCTTYRSHALTALILTISTTLLTFIIPIPFIPTPRVILQTILTGLGILLLIVSILGRAYILIPHDQPIYLYFYAVESALAIITYNLPFLFTLTSPASYHRRRNYHRNHWYDYSSSHLPLPPPTPTPTLASVPPSRATTLRSLRHKPSSNSQSTFSTFATFPTFSNPSSPTTPTPTRKTHALRTWPMLRTPKRRPSMESLTSFTVRSPQQRDTGLDYFDDGWRWSDSSFGTGTEGVGGVTPPVPVLRLTDGPFELEGFRREQERRGGKRRESEQRESVVIPMGLGV
ncbi:hypothetical protein GQ43DRAFT_430443 [Delitschia confertaspora ATCC 74209]|uniref:Rhodopsin domain-containing protein n=1 Tax=Delitschia confertaspora ATCC 74209 TaxID=1513339 RepID=A0A9P4JP01_9PLEO|nr:hypothetical protein GQ43DRAFT_430443 [Delitschia confertaspora ATCC 74209]